MERGSDKVTERWQDKVCVCVFHRPVCSGVPTLRGLVGFSFKKKKKRKKETFFWILK